ncbi:MAG TPA: hypothetical protein PKA06_10195 [Gemmatales bacterium]|nr:hypothetical protein [Gemmatales bacterium]HMP16845.1 hypothetical protein [Gemmatales bacterium]
MQKEVLKDEQFKKYKELCGERINLDHIKNRQLKSRAHLYLLKSLNSRHNIPVKVILPFTVLDLIHSDIILYLLNIYSADKTKLMTVSLRWYEEHSRQVSDFHKLTSQKQAMEFRSLMNRLTIIRNSYVNEIEESCNKDISKRLKEIYWQILEAHSSFNSVQGIKLLKCTPE